MKKIVAALAALAVSATVLTAPAQAQDKKYTIALIPGLTTDAFYITMHKGAQAAADALGVEPDFPGRAGLQPGYPGAGARCRHRQEARRHPDRTDRQDAARAAAEARPMTPASR